MLSLFIFKSLSTVFETKLTKLKVFLPLEALKFLIMNFISNSMYKY